MGNRRGKKTNCAPFRKKSLGCRENQRVTTKPFKDTRGVEDDQARKGPVRGAKKYLGGGGGNNSMKGKFETERKANTGGGCEYHQVLNIRKKLSWENGERGHLAVGKMGRTERRSHET